MKKKWLCIAVILALFLFGCPVDEDDDNGNGDNGIMRNADAVPVPGLPSGIFTASATADGAASLPDSQWLIENGAEGDPITVTVTIENAWITVIDVDPGDDSPSYVAMVLRILIPAILASNSFDVDVVSGATATSGGVLNAGMTALQKIIEEHGE